MYISMQRKKKNNINLRFLFSDLFRSTNESIKKKNKENIQQLQKRKVNTVKGQFQTREILTSIEL